MTTTKKNTIITIGREFGSGGREIGQKAAKALQLECYDTRLIQMAAEQGSMNADVLSSVDEKRASPWLYSYSSSGDYITNPQTGYNISMNDRAFHLQSNVIQQLAQRESCIIVGRCADYVLRNFKNVFSVFIQADMESRVQRIMSKYDMAEKEARAMIKKMDKERSLYYNYFTDKRWGRPDGYSMILDSSKLGVDTCVNMLCALMKSGSQQ